MADKVLKVRDGVVGSKRRFVAETPREKLELIIKKHLETLMNEKLKGE